MNVIGQIDPSAFATGPRMHHGEPSLEFPSSVSSRARGLLALKAQNWRASGGPTPPSEPTARDYVQDGLIAMWDGKENAGWGVHDATATSWVDLINGFNRTTITNGEWTEKSLRSTSGVMNATQGENSPNASLFWNAYNSGVAVTFEMMATSLSGSRHMPWKTLFKGGITRYEGGLLYIGSGLFNFANGTAYGLGNIHSVVIVDSNGGRLIVNGTQVATHSTPFSINNYPRRDYYYNQCVGEIFCSRVYNRALTDAEIAANRAIDLARFGI